MTQFTRRFLPVLVAGVLAALVTLVPTTPAHAKASVVNGTRLNAHEAALVGYINKARRNAGLAPLRVTPGTTDVARRWALHLATTRKLGHNPHFARQVEAAGSPNWTTVSENVGYASACDAKQLFDAYMKSPGHRKNILDRRMRFLGMGSVDRTDPRWPCGVTWNAMNFVDSYTSRYGTSQVPAWGIRMDRYTPAGSTGLLSLESGRDARLVARARGTLGRSTVRYDSPTSADDAVRVRLNSRGSGTGEVLFELRDAWGLDSRKRLTLRSRLYAPAGRRVTVEVTIADHFDRTTYVGAFRVGTSVTTQSLGIPASARGFGNTLKLRIKNTAVRSGRAHGATLALYRIGTA